MTSYDELESRIRIAMNVSRRFEVAITALQEIACMGDTGAWETLKATGSYRAFDEPGSVETAVNAILRIGEIAAEVEQEAAALGEKAA